MSRTGGGQPRSIEDQVRLSYYTPAPTAYSPYDPTAPGIGEAVNPGGKISTSKVPSPLDHAAKSVDHVPGPGAYSSDGAYALPEGGRLNRKPPKERQKLVDEYPVPAPCDYGVPYDPTAPRNTQGRFSREPKVPKFIQEETMRARHVPGPGAHEVQDAFDSSKPFCPEGGRTLGASKPASYFDVAPTLATSNPAPGQYSLKGSIESKAVGGTVFRYESATITDTKSLIRKEAGDRNTVPGPGTYATPQPAPIAAPPMLKGRAVGHGMPHPFAYNCAPDLSRNFGSLQPVRKSNRGSEIFGTGMKRGGSARSLEPLQPARVDRVEASEMPAGAGVFDEDGDEASANKVQWKTGGFASVKKSRSVNSLRAAQSEHPSVEDASRFYPSLSKHKQRDSSTFLPMAPKRYHPVSTHDGSDEYERLMHGRMKLKAVMEGLQHATQTALEPLDVDKLKQQAASGLQAKARSRLVQEGVSKDQQDLIMSEMHAILQEQQTSGVTQAAEQSSDSVAA